VGGYGSTRWAKCRTMTTVETTFILGIKNLSEVLPAPLRSGMEWRGVLPVWRASIEILMVSYELSLRRPDCSHLLLHYAHPESQDYITSRIMLQAIPAPRQGYQYHFVCPTRKHPHCTQLRRRLYLPLSQPVFSCILCAGPLAYLSSQQSHSKYAGVSSEFKALLIRDQARKKLSLAGTLDCTSPTRCGHPPLSERVTVTFQ